MLLLPNNFTKDNILAMSKRKGLLFLEKILFLSIFPSDILFRGKIISSFEAIWGYAQAVAGQPQSKIFVEVVNDQREQVASRAIRVLERCIASTANAVENVPQGEIMYYFKRSTKFGEWHQGYVCDSKMDINFLFAALEHCRKPFNRFLEDTQNVSLYFHFQNLNASEILFPRSGSLTVRRSEFLWNANVRNTDDPEHSQKIQIAER